MRSTYLLDTLTDRMLLMGPFELSLHTADPGDDGLLAMVGERQSVLLGQAAIGELVNAETVEFDSLPAGVVSHMGLWGAGRFLMSFEVPRQTVESGQALRWRDNTILVRFD